MFPAFEGIEYIPKKQFENAPQLIQQSNQEIILVSREFNRSFVPGIQAFAKQVDKNVIPIIILRKHEDWLVSQYKRHIKNGYSDSISAFFPINGSKGFLNADALDFYEKLLLLEKCFHQKPRVLFYEELHRDPVMFIKQLGTLLQVKIDWRKIKLKRIHTSYSTKQLQFIFWSYHLGIPEAVRRTKLYRYLMLYLGLLIPGRLFRKISLFPANYLQKVSIVYQKDWEQCIEYAASQSV